jgi:AraC family transcriptional regulator
VTDGCDCCEVSSQSSARRQFGVGDYVGRVSRSAALPNCHICTVVHDTARKVPGHAHDWPFLSTLLRGSYISRTRTREMEFEHGVAVYHPQSFQHRDEIGRDGAVFFGVQLSPDYLQDTDVVGPGAGRDIAVVNDNETYVVLGALYAARCAGAAKLELECLVAELAGCLMAPPPLKSDARPLWLERTESRLREAPQVSLDELSRDAGVHATTLTRLFRRHKNCSIGQYHARARARRAFFAVVGSTTPLSEIAQATGYADQSHMTRAFRRAFAATPAQLRRSTLTA